MVAKYDHFHCVYERDNGEEDEIEGGWTGYPEGWETMTRTEQDRWLNELCFNWGMPRSAKIVSIRLAG